MTELATLERWLGDFSTALAARDVERVIAAFVPEPFWRDLIAFSWNIATFEGREGISRLVIASADKLASTIWHAEQAWAEADEVHGWIAFETPVGRGRAHIRLKDGQCRTLLTAMRELRGFEEPVGARRRRGTETLTETGLTWRDARRGDQAELGMTRQPYVVIVGGGQSGLGLAARLKTLGVPTLIVDRLARPGDQWRSRYASLTLHDPVWYDHMPYLPFPPNWPVFTPKDKMGDWLEAYASIMELDIWNDSECVGATYDAADGTWAVDVVRAGARHRLRPAQLVFALGTSGKPFVPAIAGATEFAGPQYHSSAYGSGAEWRGKRVAVIGSNNSAHDICADLWEHGALPIMIQRSSTHIARSATLMELAVAPLYSEAAVQKGIDVDTADLLRASIPFRLMPDVHRPLFERIEQVDKAFYDRLRAAGFMLDFGEDGSGLYLKYFRRGSGYYIDVGASEMVADGRIALRSGVAIERIGESGIVLADGEFVPADAIVYATGFGSMDQWVGELISPDIADRIGKCWGLGSGTTNDPGPWEGELRNMWKPTAQPGLWFHGGNLANARHYSTYLALQLKARFEGLPIDVVQSVA